MNPSESIKKNATFVNKFLKKELRGDPKQLYDAASHLIIHGGKRLRPYLVLKSCKVLGGKQADAILDMLKQDAERTYKNYEEMLNERFDGTTIDESKDGLARELARMNLTLNTYTQWYWKTDLLNLLNFLNLRADNHAQYEIRIYADAMLKTVKKWVPIAYEAFVDYRVGGLELSSKSKLVIEKMIKGQACNFENSNLSKREWNELMESFGFTEKII